MRQGKVLPFDAALNRAEGLSTHKRPKTYRHFHPELGHGRIFSAEQVKELRRRVAAKEITIAALARDLGRHPNWLALVIDGTNYAWVI